MSTGSIQVNTGNTSVQQMSLNKDDIMALLKESLDRGEPFATEFTSRIIRPLTDKINQKISVSELRVDGSSIGQLITKVLTDRAEEALEGTADKYYKAVSKVGNKLIEDVERDSSRRAKGAMDLGSILTGVSKDDDLLTKLKWTNLRWTVFKKAEEYTKSITFDTATPSGKEVFDLNRILGDSPRASRTVSNKWNTTRSNLLAVIDAGVNNIRFTDDTQKLNIDSVLGASPDASRGVTKKWNSVRNQLLSKISGFIDTGVSLDGSQKPIDIDNILGKAPESSRAVQKKWGDTKQALLSQLMEHARDITFDESSHKLDVNKILGDTPESGMLFKARWSLLRHSLLSKIEKQIKQVTFDPSMMASMALDGAATAVPVSPDASSMALDGAATAIDTLSEAAELDMAQHEDSVQERDPTVIVGGFSDGAIEDLSFITAGIQNSFKNLHESLDGLFDGVEGVGKGGIGKLLTGMLGGALIGKLGGTGKALLAAGPVAAVIGGIVWAGIDAFRGWSKSGDWGTSKLSGAIGGMLGGMDKGFAGAFKNMGKWALIGAGVGSVVPVVGTLIGGLIGAALGGILGAIGGERISKASDFVGKWVFGVFDQLFDGIKLTFGWIKDIGVGVVNFVKDFLDPSVSAVDLLKDSIAGIVNFFWKVGSDIVQWTDGTMTAIFGGAWDSVKSGISGVVDWIGNFFDGLLDRVKNLPIIGRLFNRVTDEEKEQRRNDRLDVQRAERVAKLEREIQDLENTASGDGRRANAARRRLQAKQSELAGIQPPSITPPVAPVANDFVWRSGEPIQPFNSNDNLISVKDDKTFATLLTVLKGIGSNDIAATPVVADNDIDRLVAELRKMGRLMEDMITRVTNQVTQPQAHTEVQPLPAVHVNDVRDPAYKLRSQAWSRVAARPGGLI